MLDGHHATAHAPGSVPAISASPRVSGETLLEQVADGDGEAFSALYDRFAPAIYGVARRVVVDPSIAQEVTQEVLLAVWANARSFDRSRGSARVWILTMAHRRAVDVVRSEQARRDRIERLAAAAVDTLVEDIGEGVVDGAAERARAGDVRRALDGLTVLQRSALELAYYNGLTYPQVAQVLGVPLGTAKSRIRDGLRRLAAQLAPTGSLSTS